MAEVGPDGNVWAIDSHNYTIQHNPTPTGHKTRPGGAYENPRRDKQHGRIYRDVWNDGKPSPQPDLQTAKPPALVAPAGALQHPSAGVRRNAATVLPRSVASVAAIGSAGLLKDSDAQVRLAAMLALAEAPDVPVAAQALHDALATPALTLDRWSG